jgi:hypothetical protein
MAPTRDVTSFRRLGGEMRLASRFHNPDFRPPYTYFKPEPAKLPLFRAEGSLEKLLQR